MHISNLFDFIQIFDSQDARIRLPIGRLWRTHRVAKGGVEKAQSLRRLGNRAGEPSTEDPCEAMGYG